MAAKIGLFRHGFADWSKESLLSREGYSELGLGSSEDDEESVKCSCFDSVRKSITSYLNSFQETAEKLCEMGRSDPRKIIFAAKMGLSLALVSVIIFFKEELGSASQYSVWAIITVVMVFEFSVGAMLNKGFNRTLGTLCAGGFAMGLAELFMMLGGVFEVYIIISVFVTGFCASYARLYPTLKLYEYGLRIFVLTFCIVIVSGTSSSTILRTAFYRLSMVGVGAGVSLVVNTCICPIWAGEDLHKLVVKNLKGVATSLEGCVNEYLQCVEYRRVSSKTLTYQASDDPVYNGCRTAVQSSSNEESLLDFALWEPPHGPYRTFHYPWKNYVEVGGALRHCAIMVMAMHACIISEIQAPPEKRQVFRSELQMVSTKGAKVLRELGDKVEKMEKLSSKDILLEVQEAAEELQMKIDHKSYLLVNSESWRSEKLPKEIEDPPQNFLDANNNIEDKPLVTNSSNETIIDFGFVPVPRTWEVHVPNTDTNRSLPAWPSSGMPFNGDHMFNEQEARTYESASSLSLATFASLLIEFVARLQNLVDSFQELSEAANFREQMVTQAEKEVGGFWTRCFWCFWFKSS
ncbi:aluminum-activated malate transporter 4-like [Cornus florida]|uniref:aluminum-activated malate transporter 4-like n=1 Tax=Cornus florida TaxID=4283 RepID=UPI0028A2B6C1|nr:aluminum-activated malate transporter 4-like [Cornus florida]